MIKRNKDDRAMKLEDGEALGRPGVVVASGITMLCAAYLLPLSNESVSIYFVDVTRCAIKADDEVFINSGGSKGPEIRSWLRKWMIPA